MRVCRNTSPAYWNLISTARIFQDKFHWTLLSDENNNIFPNIEEIVKQTWGRDVISPLFESEVGLTDDIQSTIHSVFKVNFDNDV